MCRASAGQRGPKVICWRMASEWPTGVRSYPCSRSETVQPAREPNGLELRSHLQRLTDSLQGDRAGEQIEAIRQLRSSCPHSIVLVQQPIRGQPSTGSYTCPQYSFGLVDPPAAVRAIMLRYPDV